MKTLKGKVIALLVIIFRTVLLFWDFDSGSFDWSIYFISFYKTGNDYYLASIASAIYVLSAVLLLVSLFLIKKQKKLLLVSILGVLLASGIEIIVYFLFQSNNMYVPGLIFSASGLFLGSLGVLIGFVAVENFGKSVWVLGISSIFAIVVHLLYLIWAVSDGQSLNLTLGLSYILNFLIYPLVCDKSISRRLETTEKVSF